MEGKISFNSICEQFKKQILIFVTHYRKMTWAVVLGKAVILPVLTSDWLFKAMFPVSCNCLNGVLCSLETRQIVLRNSLKDESYIFD